MSRKSDRASTRAISKHMNLGSTTAIAYSIYTPDAGAINMNDGKRWLAANDHCVCVLEINKWTFCFSHRLVIYATEAPSFERDEFCANNDNRKHTSSVFFDGSRPWLLLLLLRYALCPLAGAN